MQAVEQTLDSREVAEMVEKDHSKLLRDIRKYCKQLAEAKIGLGDFFSESTYLDSNNQSRPCYRITKKGCEFIAHKLTGTKGTIFTAKYINRFHEMRDILSQKGVEPELPWFIRKFRGKYIILEKDFLELAKIDKKTFWKIYKIAHLDSGYDFNGWGWKCTKEEFRQQYGFDPGEELTVMYFTMRGFEKMLKALKDYISQDAYKALENGLEQLKAQKRKIEKKEDIPCSQIKRNTPEDVIQINIVLNQDRYERISLETSIEQEGAV